VNARDTGSACISTLGRLLEINMNGRRGPVFASVFYVALSFLSAPVDFAQTGAAATKQMQDTQRKAQQKAREAKKAAPPGRGHPD
jgi:hypothetical protein